MASVDTAETAMHGGDTAVKSTAVETTVEATGVETTGVDTAAMEAVVEPAAVEPATMEAAAMSSASTRMGEIWLAENSRAQQRSCNAHHSPCLPGGGFVIA